MAVNDHYKTLAWILEEPDNALDINHRSIDNKTPLHLAAIYHSVNVLGYLVALNAIVDIEDDEGNTALYYATAESFTSCTTRCIR